MYNVQNDENNIIKATETLKNFLCSEGILPTRIIRLLRQETETQYTVNVMADILLSRENFDPNVYENPKQYENITSILKEKPFDNDPELISWLQKASTILNILKTKEIYPGIETPEDMHITCIETLIKTCPFSNDETKSSYINQLRMQKRPFLYPRPIITDSIIKKKEFAEFLSGKSRTTVLVYTSSLNFINTQFKEKWKDITDNSLWEIKEIDTIEKITKLLNSTPDFIKINRARRNNLTVSLMAYKNFLITSQNNH